MWVHGKRRDAGARRLSLQGGDLVWTVRNAGAAMLGLEPRFGFAGDEDFVEAFRLRAIAHPLDERVHAVAIVALGHEQIRPYCQEEVADVLRPVVDLVLIRNAAGEARAGDDAAENVHPHRQARALVAADRQHYAAERRGRIGCGAALGIESVAERNAFAAPFCPSDFSARRDCRRHVEQEWWKPAAGCTGRERVGAEKAILAAPRR